MILSNVQRQPSDHRPLTRGKMPEIIRNNETTDEMAKVLWC